MFLLNFLSNNEYEAFDESKMDLCAGNGMAKFADALGSVIQVVRWAVPIILILFVVIDLVKGMMNPDGKDNTKKIFNRVISAIIVFLVPSICKLILWVIQGNTTVDNCGTVLSKIFK